MVSLASTTLKAALPIWSVVFSIIVRRRALNHLCFVEKQGNVVYSLLVTFQIDVAPVKVINSWRREETLHSPNTILILLDLLGVLCRAVSLPLVELCVYRDMGNTQGHVQCHSLFMRNIMEVKISIVFVVHLLGPHLLLLMPAKVK